MCDLIGLGQGATAAAMIYRAPENHALHGVTIGEGAVEPLEHHQTATFAWHITIRASVEGVATTVG
ncbi:predicted protein [Streptomyces iranensis]|uniref:Uncharacterized protein n=1 Tax=Streptomyces iranensis TaxID=576784 RepID=A0A061ABG0_9ACTN|nr:predicted protein [Streptomyces iranensis]